MRWLRRLGLGLLILVLGLVLVYLAGPKPYPETDLSPEYVRPDLELEALPAFVAAQDAQVADLKAGNEARFLWADSTRATPWSIVYLHGFSAGPIEGYPIVRDLAERYQCNTYFPRLADHGRASEDSFRDIEPEALLESVYEALEIGQTIGEKVLVVGSSTGAGMGLYLNTTVKELADAFVVYSPNFQLANPNARYITGPWGYEITKTLIGSDYRQLPFISEVSEQYWTRRYHINGLITLQRLLEHTTAPQGWESGFELPVMIGYYYKDEANADEIISIPRVSSFFEAIRTPAAKKQLIAFPNVGGHVIHSPVESKDVDAVYEATIAFLENVLEW